MLKKHFEVHWEDSNVIHTFKVALKKAEVYKGVMVTTITPLKSMIILFTSNLGGC